MRIKKYSLVILSILLILLIFVSSASAADTNGTDIISIDESTNNEKLALDYSPDTTGESNDTNIIENNENNLLSADNDESGNVLRDGTGTFADLQTEISTALSSGDYVKLTKDTYTYAGSGSQIEIGKSCTIDGNGAVIDMANSGNRAFYVTVDSGVTIKNLTIKNANFNGGDGGAIYFSGLGTITNCNFTDNYAFSQGGAIWMSSGSVENCKFTDNTAFNGGAIHINSGSVENCKFTDNTATSNGGAIYFGNSVTVTNCNFTGNKATASNSYGGAIYFNREGSVTNCNFTDNTAFDGGAIYFSDSGTVTNCNFTGNNATTGSAIYFFWKSATKTISNSRFLNNRANAETLEITKNDNNITITFTGNDNLLNAIYSRNDGEVTFTNVTYWSANGITNTGSSTPARSNKEAGQNITVEIYDSKENLVDNVTLVTDDNGQVIYDFIKLSNGNYTYKAYHSEDCYYTYAENPGTFTLDSTLGDFNRLQKYINGAEENSVLTLYCDYTFTVGADENLTEGIVIDKPLTINGNGHTIDALQKARIFQVTSGNVVLNNITFTNAAASSSGGAVYFSSSGSVINCNFTNNSATGSGGAIRMASGSVTNCNFTNNKATGNNWGGAIVMASGSSITNCNFINNSASYGGAVYISYKGEVTNCNFTNNSATNGGGAIWMNYGNVTNCNFTANQASGNGGAINMGSGTVTNCNFTGNNATTGSAIYFYRESYTKTVSNSRFLNNRANAEALEVTKNDNNITITFTGKDNLLNAIYSNDDVTFTNVTYWSANGITNTGISEIKPSRSNKEAGQNITVGVVVNDIIVLNEVKITDENGMVVLDNINVGENYFIGVRHDTDSYYTEKVNTTSNNTKFNVNVTSQTTNNRTVNITAKSNMPQDILEGKLLFILPNSTEINATYTSNGTWWALHTFDDAGDYNINATYIGLDNVTINNATISIRYDASVDVNNNTLNLLVGDNFTIVATTVPEGVNVTFVQDDSGVYIVDENGNVIALKEGKGSVLVKVGGDGIYAKNSTIVNVAVYKKLIVSAPDLTKSYMGSEKFVVNVTDGWNNPLADKSVNITINGVTYTRTTDENGTASLNINLNSGEYAVNVAVDDEEANSTVIVKATIDASDVTKVFKNSTQYYARFVDVNGTPLDHATVSFNINGMIYNRTTDENGTAVMNINLGEGEYIITATNPVTGEMKSNSINVISLIESSDLTKYYKNDSQFVVRIHSDDGGYVGAGEEVKFNVNGVFYTKKTNATGHATLNINLPQGNYTITTYYKDCSQGNSIEVLPILNASDLEMKYKDGSQFKATLVDGQGNAYAGQIVQFNINGMFYNKETDSDGIAKLNINLMPGEYIITSSYNGANIANKITIRG